jgi:DNA-binding MarR family transcriptional regulator
VAGAEGSTVRFADGSSLDVGIVIWRTGYRSHYSWIRIPGVVSDGQVIHSRGVTDVPGLYFLGLPWQHGRGSALLGFVHEDAAYLTDRITSRAPARQSAGLAASQQPGLPDLAKPPTSDPVCPPPIVDRYADNLYSANMSEELTTSPRPLPQPDANLGYLFRLAHQRFRARLDNELEDLGLSAQEYGILSAFETMPELSTSELARISQVTRQTMHTSILSLEAAGLVERSARNQRVVLVRLTKRGRKCLETATHRVRAVERAALADLSCEDERTVRTWLATLAAMTTSPGKAAARRQENP